MITKRSDYIWAAIAAAVIQRSNYFIGELLAY